MKTFSFDLLAETVKKQRKAKGMTQAELSEATGMNRSMIGQMEKWTFKPSIEQLEALGRVLEFDVSALYLESPSPRRPPARSTISPWPVRAMWGCPLPPFWPSTTTSPPWTFP